MAKNQKAISALGGNNSFISQYDAALYTIVTPVNYSTGCDLGELVESDTPIIPTTTDSKNEKGIISYSYDEWKGEFTAILQQRNKELVEALAYTFRNMLMLFWRDLGVVNGSYEEELGFIRIHPQKSTKTPGADKTMKVMGTIVAPDVAVTILAIDITAMKTAYGVTTHSAGPITLPAGQDTITTKTSYP